MKLTEIKPGELYVRDWRMSTDNGYLSFGSYGTCLYMMLWQDMKVGEAWMGVWDLERAVLIEFDEEPAVGAEFRLVK